MSDANYYNRFVDNDAPENQQKNNKKEIVSETGYSIAKVFGYMFIGLAITAAIALGLGALFRYIFGVNYETGIDANLQNSAAITLIVLLIVSFIGIIILSFVVPITVARGKRSVLVPSIIYTVLMGVALSTICIFIPWSLLGLTFGITSLVFGLMALIALLSKGRLNGLAIAAMGLFIGAAMLSLALWIMMLCGVFSGPLYWIISLATFAAVMLITIWDMARIKTIAKNGEMTTNLSLYCAFILYNDFIYIFLRILRIVIIVMGKKN